MEKNIMRTVLISTLIAFFPAFAAAQTGAKVAPGSQPATNATRVVGHVMGESAEDFFAETGYSQLISVCKEGLDKKDLKNALKAIGFHDTSICAGIVSAEAGGQVETTDPHFPYPELHPFARLEDGKLASVTLHFPSGLADVLSDMIEKYGRPSATGSQTLQNGYGAKFEEGNASWEMPDGARIMALEAVTWDDILESYMRTTTVVFYSAAEKARLDADGAARSAAKKNPFN
jgi:hypothetical protein